jgi:cold shock protein
MNDSAERLSDVEGTVKWFDPRKGFGFILGPDGQDIFVHFSVIQGDGFRVLKDGSRVMYDAEKCNDRWKATKAVRVDDPEITIKPPKGYSRSPRR